MKLDLELEKDCEFKQYYPRNITCESGVIVDYSGTGRWTRVETDEKCPRCSGTGSVLTDTGREIVQLVRKWKDVADDDL